MRWYKKWHDFRFAHHIHVAVLVLYLVGAVAGAISPFGSHQVNASAGSFAQTAFNGSSDGTYTSTGPVNAGADLALSNVTGLTNGNSTAWSYKRVVTVSNSSGGSLTDYQVKISLTTAVLGSPYTHFKTDGSDMRFTDSTSTTEYPYWIESWSNTGTSVVWVKVSGTLATGNTDLNLYYGNANATFSTNCATAPNNKANCGASTFIGFNDGTSLTGWNQVGATASGGVITIAANASGANYLSFGSAISRPVIVQYDVTVPNYYLEHGLFSTAGAQGYNTSPNAIFWYDAGDTNRHIVLRNTSVDSGTNSGSRTAAAKTIKMMWGGTIDTTKFYMGPQGGTLSQVTTPVSNFPANTSFYFTISQYPSYAGSAITVDNITIRSYATGDNTVTAGNPGAEVNVLSLSGSYLTSAISNTGLYGNWGNITFNASSSKNGGPANTYLSVQVCDGAGNPISSANITAGANTAGAATNANTSNDSNNNNLPGFWVSSGATGTINLSNISTANYSTLKLKVNMVTTNSANTPLLNDWTVNYNYDYIKVPQSVLISEQTSSSAKLTWNTNGSNALLGYLVDRAPESSPGSGVPGTWASASGAGGTTCAYSAATYAGSVSGRTTCTDTGLSPNTKYFWRIRSVDINNNLSGYTGEYSNDASTKGLWHFNDGAGTTVTDASGNGNTATINIGASGTQTSAGDTSTVGTAWYAGKTGKFGGSLNFDGTDDKVVLSSAPTSGTGSFSIFAWIKTSSTGTRKSIINYGGATTNTSVYLYINTANKVECDLAGSTGPTSASTVTDGSWHHVGVVNNAGSFQIYVDGSTSGSPVSLSPNIGTGVSPRIGAVDWDAYYFSGQIDEVWVSNIARTSSEISTYMAYATEQPTSSMTRPGQPTIGVTTAVDSTHLSANWTAPSGGATTYNVYRDGTQIATGVAGTSYADSGLGVNTSHVYTVSSVNATGEGDQSGTSAPKYTLANAPGTPTFGVPTTSSIPVIITENSNPATTTYAIYETTQNKYVQANGTLSVSAVWRSYAAWGGASGVSVVGLSLNQQYTFEAKAKNGDSTATSFSVTASKSTLANVPGTPTLDSATNFSIIVKVNKNNNPESPTNTQYAIYEETQGKYVQTNGALGASEAWQSYAAWGGASGFSVNGLSASREYTFEVKAQNNDGVPTAFSNPGTKYTVPNVPSAPTLVATGNGSLKITINVNGNPDNATYAIRLVSIFTQYVDCDGGLTEDIGSACWKSKSDWDGVDGGYNVAGLASNTKYDVSIIAQNPENSKTDFSSVASKYTLAGNILIDSPDSPTKNPKPPISNSADPDSASYANLTVKLYEKLAGPTYNLLATRTANVNGVFTFSGTDYTTPLSSDGAHELIVVALNGNGIESSKDDVTPVTVILDTVAPVTARETDPASPDNPTTAEKTEEYYSTRPTITLTPNDPEPTSGIGHTYYWWDNLGHHEYTGPFKDDLEGTHTLSWYSTDAAGNQESIQTFEYKLDTVAPTGTLDIPTYTNIDFFSPNVTFDDQNGSGLGEVKMSNDGIAYCPVDMKYFLPTISTFWWDITGTLVVPVGENGPWLFGNSLDGCGDPNTSDGSHTVYIKFIDNAGNVSAPIEKTVILDRGDPSYVTAQGHVSVTDNTSLSEDEWHNYTKPNFTFTATDATSGVDHFQVYLGDNAGFDMADAPIQVIATATENTNEYTGSYSPTLSSSDSGKNLYLKVRAVDKVENSVAGNIPENLVFTYKFDNTPPNKVSSVIAKPSGWSTKDPFTFEWTAATDVESNGSSSGLKGYEYQVEDGADLWYFTTTLTATDINHYTNGANRFTVRTVDNAGNRSDQVNMSNKNGAYFYYSGSVAAPRNVKPDKSQSQGETVNRFKFTWEAPEGINVANYYYSVNDQPTPETSTKIPGTQTETSFDSFAKKPGLNKFYIVAEDELGNIGWANPSEPANFSITTAKPASPQNLSVTDSSVRSSPAKWALTLLWNEASLQTPDAKFYVVERSENGTDFSERATLEKTNTGYLDTGLTEAKTYYYRIRTKDSIGNLSDPTNVVSEKPTGAFVEPPKITSGPTAEPKALSVKIEWATDRDSNSVVKYRPVGGAWQEASDSTNYITDHAIEIFGLAPGVTYEYKVQSIDQNFRYNPANAYSNVKTFATLPAPGISDVQISEIRLYSAILSWKTTSSSTSKILYGTSTAYGKAYTDSSGSQTTTHTVKLDSLSDSTTYHFKIQGTDVDGNVLNSDDYVFTTLTFPKLSNLKVSQVQNTATSTVQVVFDSNVPTSVQIDFAGSKGKEVADYKLSTTHNIKVSGLADDTAYSITVKARDQYGNEALPLSTTYRTEFDTRPPVISDITVESSINGYGVDAKGNVVISWNTDEPGTSQVEYGSGVAGTEYSSKTQEDTSLTENHVVVISELKTSSPYHFRVVSKDKAGNSGISGDNSIITQQANKSVIDVIIKTLQSSIGWIFTSFSLKQ